MSEVKQTKLISINEDPLKPSDVKVGSKTWVPYQVVLEFAPSTPLILLINIEKDLPKNGSVISVKQAVDYKSKEPQKGVFLFIGVAANSNKGNPKNNGGSYGKGNAGGGTYYNNKMKYEVDMLRITNDESKQTSIALQGNFRTVMDATVAMIALLPDDKRPKTLDGINKVIEKTHTNAIEYTLYQSEIALNRGIDKEPESKKEELPVTKTDEEVNKEIEENLYEGIE